MSTRSTAQIAWLCGALFAAWIVGMQFRGYWTPDEPREADLSWRMSHQADKAVPSLAGEAFCEKPPFTYWIAGASMQRFGMSAWAARLPNLAYALITAIAVLLLARRAAGAVAGMAAAAAISTFLLSYQVAIWLATDAPLVAAVSVALLGLYIGFYAADRRERLGGYTLMHAALALGFLAKSAAAWMVPALAFATLLVWERRWRELLRWEFYVGAVIQAIVISIWVWLVYTGADGVSHIKVFFWDNLVGRFTEVGAPAKLEYTAGHRNTPGKYLIELPLYLWPWTLLVVAAVRSAWRLRRCAPERMRAVRFAIACFVPTLALLSLAATARNIYLAPALPGAALLLGWWAGVGIDAHDPWDAGALRATAILVMIGAVLAAAALSLIGFDAWNSIASRTAFVAIGGLGIGAAAYLAVRAWAGAKRGRFRGTLAALLAAYCLLLIGPASQAYRQVDRWHDLGSIGRALKRDLGTAPLVLIAPDETTRAWVDLYTRTAVTRIPLPSQPSTLGPLRAILSRAPDSRFVVQLPGRDWSPRILALAAKLGIHHAAPAANAPPPWLAAAHLAVVANYALPYGRRYALLKADNR